MTAEKSRFYVLASLGLFALSMAQNWARPAEEMPLFNEALRAGASLSSSGSLSNPFRAAPTGPTAHVAPAYPYVASLIVSTFGVEKDGHFVLQLVTNLAVASLVGLLPLSARLLGLGFSTGLIAGLLYVAAEVPTFPAWEASYSALLGMLLTVLVSRFVTYGYRTPLALCIGLLWGILILTSPTVSLLFLVWFGYCLFQIKRDWSRLPRVAIVAACLPVLLVLPWTIRNGLVLGSLVPVRDNFGLELYVSNNPCTAFNMAKNFETGCFQQNHPNDSLAEAELVRALGEVAYNQQKLKRAIAWITSNPDRFLELTAQRLVHFWLPSDQADLRLILQDQSGHRRYSLIVCVTTLLSLPGVYLIVSDKKRWLAVILGLWQALFPLAYYVTQFNIRYRVPILWITFMQAGYVVISLYRRQFLASSAASEASRLP